MCASFRRTESRRKRSCFEIIKKSLLFFLFYLHSYFLCKIVILFSRCFFLPPFSQLSFLMVRLDIRGRLSMRPSIYWSVRPFLPPSFLATDFKHAFAHSLKDGSSTSRGPSPYLPLPTYPYPPPLIPFSIPCETRLANVDTVLRLVSSTSQLIGTRWHDI